VITVVPPGYGLISYPEHNVLAGSSTLLKDCIPNIIKFTGCSMTEAFERSRYNPDQLNSFHDRGRPVIGNQADLVLSN
jgi:N-acetylglucosamine-6-phosphate deacetylase